jgi:colicin import membrane protein
VLRALSLAILAHLVLLAVLSVGVQWKRDAVPETIEAELWARVPIQAAAPAPEPVAAPEPPKPVPPTPKPEPKPESKPEPKPVTPPPDTAKAEADIALLKEKEKAKQLKEKKLALEKAELEKKKKLAELEKQKQAKLEQAKLEQAKLEQDKKDKADKLKKEQADKVAKAKEEQQRKQDAKEAQVIDDQRKATIKRMAGLAGSGGNGSPGSTSTALESKSLSNSYAGRIRSYIKRFHTYTETVSGNPTTEIEVRLSSDGSILSRRITKPSGTKSWDDAALNAIDKAEKLPLDENGRAPSPMTIIWSAQEVAR